MEYLLFLQNLRNSLGPVIEQIFVWISDYGFVWTFFVPFIIYWLINKKDGLFVIFSFCISAVVNVIIKVTACELRPWKVDSRIVPSEIGDVISISSYSMPSGHASMSVGAYGAAAIKSNKKWIKWVLWIFTILICFSRNYLGAHTPWDVLVGALSSLVILYLLTILEKWMINNKDKEKYVLIGVIVFSVLTLLYTFFKSYPDGTNLVKVQKHNFEDVGALLGFVLGAYLVINNDVFNTDKLKLKNIILRVVVGIVIMNSIYYGLGYLMYNVDQRISLFVIYFILYFFGTYLVPLIFTKLEYKIFKD